MTDTTVTITDRGTGSLGVTVETDSFAASWMIRKREDEWQALVATDGGGGSHGLFETRDAALEYVLEKADVYGDDAV